MDLDLVFGGAAQLLILMLSVSLHESAHAWMADRCGDPTGRLLGRVSLNPFVHLELFGTVIVPLLLVVFRLPVFGWGRTVYVKASNLRHPGWDDAKVSAAGPAVNLALAMLGSAALLVAVAVSGEGGRIAALHALGAPLAGIKLDALGVPPPGAMSRFPLMFLLARLASINAFLAVFNLIPVPPFDGGNIVLNLLPPDWARKFANLPRYGLMIALALAVLGNLVLLGIFWLLLTQIIGLL
jgi:Zn-dependent protease